MFVGAQYTLFSPPCTPFLSQYSATMLDRAAARRACKSQYVYSTVWTGPQRGLLPLR